MNNKVLVERLIAGLIAERDALQRMEGSVANTVRLFSEAIAALSQSESEAQDAARYRWLRENALSAGEAWWDGATGPQELDYQIDVMLHDK